MSAKNRPYEQFGSFILFKKLETDALGDLWRAGRVDNGQLGPIMAVRRLLRSAQHEWEEARIAIHPPNCRCIGARRPAVVLLG